MNKLGISSACFYPLETEHSFNKLCNKNIDCAELFFNSPSELMPNFIKSLNDCKKNDGLDIVSVHPFMSFAESFFLFSSYERRFIDIMPLYQSFFEAMQYLDSKIFVIHGSKIPGSISDELYFERFAKLIEKGKEYGVLVCQENVVDYRSQSVDYIIKMSDYIGSDFGLVLDIKQARRAKQNVNDFIDKVGKYIKHVHISDFNGYKDCIPPLEGNFDFPAFFDKMNEINYTGAYIIELYKHSYNSEEQIFTSYKKVKSILTSSF